MVAIVVVADAGVWCCYYVGVLLLLYCRVVAASVGVCLCFAAAAAAAALVLLPLALDKPFFRANGFEFRVKGLRIRV